MTTAFRHTTTATAFAILAFVFIPTATALTADETAALVELIDERQRNSGDFKGRFLLDQKQKDKNDIVYDGVYFRRDEDDRLMILFPGPKGRAGKRILANQQEFVVLRRPCRKMGTTNRTRANRRYNLKPPRLRRITSGGGIHAKAPG